MGNELVESPAGAVLEVSQGLLDAGDGTAQLRVTAHQIGTTAVTNIWQCYQGEWGRLIPEQQRENRQVNLHMLLGEMTRLAYNPQFLTQISNDLRLKLGFMGLIMNITEAIKADRQSSRSGE